jgi:hypothetical protein
MMAAPGQKYEEEVAAPTRLKAEETRVGRLADLYSMLAQLEQGSFESSQERMFRNLQTPRFSGVGGYGNGGGSVPYIDFSIAG